MQGKQQVVTHDRKLYKCFLQSPYTLISPTMTYEPPKQKLSRKQRNYEKPEAYQMTSALGGENLLQMGMQSKACSFVVFRNSPAASYWSFQLTWVSAMN